MALEPAADVARLVQHAGFVRSLARSLVRGDDLAEDVVQDTYVAALASSPGEVRRPRAWFASVARNMARRIHRREARLEARHREAPPRPGPESPAEVVGRGESLRRVTTAVLALPDEQREVVLLRYYEGVTPTEIAQRLGVPLETVRSRLRRALERLRGRLDQEWAGDRRAWIAALLPWALPARIVAPLTAALVAACAVAAVAVGLWLALGRGERNESSHGSSVEAAAAPTAAPSAPRAAPVLFAPGARSDAGTGTLLGRVRLEGDGAPAKDARIRVFGPGAEGKVASAESTASSDGEFRVLDLPAGEGYVVELVAAGAPRRLVPGVAVLAGRVTRLGTIWLGERAILAIRVLDDVEVAVAGAEVEVRPDLRASAFASFVEEMLRDPIGLLAGLDAPRPAVAAARSDASGLARIEGLAPGGWEVTVRAPESSIRVEHVLAAVGTTEVVVRLRLARPFAGRVVGEDGRGVAGVRVAVLGTGIPDLAAIAAGETGSDGAFLFRSPPAATSYDVLVAAPGRSTLALRNVDPRTEARIVLRSGVALDVRVTAADGTTPAAGTRVLVLTQSRGPEGLLDETHAGTTDASGRLVFSAQPGTIHVARAVHPTLGSGWWMPEAENVPFPSLTGLEDVRIGPEGRSISLALFRGVDVRGRVTDEHGAAVAGALVDALGGALLGTGGTAETDADGRYVLHGCTPGMALVGVYAQDLVQQGRSYMANEAPDAEGNIPHDVVLRPARLVTGRVLGPDRRPVPGADVSASSDGMPTFTDAEGRYALDGIPRETSVRVSARSRGLSEVTVDVKAGEESRTTAPDLVLSEDLPLDVRVVDGAGRGVAGARIMWVPAGEVCCCVGNTDVHREWTNRDGRVPGWRVPDGAGAVSVQAPGFAPARQSVDADERDHVELHLAPGTQMRGRVLDDAGRPVPEVTVTWTSEEEDCPCGLPDAGPADVTDGDGAFRLRDLPAPPLRIEVEAPGRRPIHVDVASTGGVLEVRLPAVDPAALERRAALRRERKALVGRLVRGMPEEEANRVGKRVVEIEKELEDGDVEGGAR